MRFCPFCSAENADELAVCQACGRRLPPLPPRRARNAPPTGIQLPPRAATTAPPPQRKSGNTVSPMPPMPAPITAPITAPQPAQSTPPAQLTPSAQTPAMTLTPSSMPTPPMSLFPDSQPLPTRPITIPPPMAPPDHVPTAAQIQADDAARRALLHAITPGPAAQRREAPPSEARVANEPARRRADASTSVPPASQPIPRIAQTMPLASAPPALQRPPAPVTPPPLRTPEPHDTATHERTDLEGTLVDPSSSSSSVEGQTVRYPGRAPSPTDDVEEVDVVTRLNSLAAPPPPTAAARPPPTPTSVRSQPPPQPTPLTVPTPRPPTALPLQPPAAESVVAPLTPPPQPLVVQPRRPLTPTGGDPPPTRIQRPDQLADRPFTPPKVHPIPEIPEPGLIHAARYAARFARARYQRRGAIKGLGIEIKQDTEALDHVLGALGREARQASIESRVFSAENGAITAAEQRVAQLHREHTEVDARKADEGSKFVDVERDRTTKLAEAERLVEEAQRELQTHEATRRGLRDKRKDIERRQKAYLKSAEDHNRQAGSSQMGDQRNELRRAAEGHSREAAALEPDRQELDRRITALERPIGESTAKLDAAKAELDAAKRSLNDAREGHTHRLAELDSEHKRKSREIALAESEISRRLVTLGTLVNLNRIEDPHFAELYQRIDRLRGAITARTTEIEKLTAERDAYDRGTLVRGIVAFGGAFVALIALVVILRAIL